MYLRWLKKRPHVSWLIAVLSASIIVGVVFAQIFTGFNHIVWLLVGAMLAGIVLWRKSIYLFPLLILSGLIIGLWRGSIVQSELTIYKHMYQAELIVTGRVSEDADIGKHDELLLRIDNLRAGGRNLPGKIWVSTKTKFDIKRSDIVTVEGKLQPGFGNFAATIYQAEITRVQRPQPGDVARQVRDWFADGVHQAVGEPQASLGLGYLVGQRRALPPELAQALVIAGLTHVVVASGYNLTILVRFARRLFDKVSKYLAALVSGAMIFIFIMITGMSPSMSRAGLVAGLALAAWYYGRKFHPLILLPFAAAITLLINPSYGWGDLGWQLSFAAFAGVMILAPLLQAYFFGNKEPSDVRRILGETVSAQIVTLPILVLAFGQFSNVAIVANLLILPFVPLAMLLTFIAGIGGLYFPGVGFLFGLPAQWLLAYMTTVTEYLAKLPWAQGEIQIGSLHVVVAYIVIVGICIYLWRATRYDLRDSNLVE
jgi:competence protein ComEC